MKTLLALTLLTLPAMAEDRSHWDEVTWTDYLIAQHREDGWDGPHRTPDGSYVDVMMPGYAAEVDWAGKWQEGIGQCLFYAIATNRKPCLILLIKDWKTDRKYYLRALAVCGKYDIRLITVEAK